MKLIEPRFSKLAKYVGEHIDDVNEQRRLGRVDFEQTSGRNFTDAVFVGAP
jgi:hypothetical protein